VSLKILIADDSMTAQNMGKKILVDAGFDVVPVSNGAAAIKKIAETKPDIIILDIYMPGYTGLEVCEKVKNAPETASVPVLLTVGKLEPYRPEDGAKVKAEGVIIKPFEASDLLSALGRIAEKYNLNVPQVEAVEIEAPVPNAAPMVAAATATVAAAAVGAVAHEAPKADEYQPLVAQNIDAALAPLVSEPAPAHPSEVPDFIREASAAAAAPSAVGAPAPMFIIEEEAVEENSAPAFDLSDLSVPAHEAPAFVVDEIAIPEVEEPIEPFKASSIRDEDPTAAWNFGEIPASNTPVKIEPEALTVPTVPEVPQIEPELETTAAAKVYAQVENLMELEPEFETPVEVAPTVDPALVTQPDELMQFTVKVGADKVEEPETQPAETPQFASHEPESFGDDVPVVAEYSDAAAGQHSYEDDPMVQMGAISIDAPAENAYEVSHSSDSGDDTMKLSLAHSSGLEGALHEYEAAVEAEVPAAEVVAQDANEAAAIEPVTEIVPEASHQTSVVAQMAAVTPEFAEIPSETVHHQDFAHSVTDAVEAAVEHGQEETKTLAAAAGLDASTVARAVQRVFERYKAQMVADITDELSKGE
jgi:CheY-like chemotaxis protein